MKDPVRPSRSMKPALALAIGLIGVVLASGCSTFPRGRQAATLAPFASDGCSLFPDGTFKQKTLWLDCCIEHDVAYWKGGTRAERRAADARLRDCIIEKTGDRKLAQLVYDGVRAGGGPLFPTWYRWAYGWPYGRGYAPLTEAEVRQVQSQLDELPAQ